MDDEEEERLHQSRERNNFKKTEERDSFSLLDGASAQIPAITPELDLQRKIASDHSRSLEERLESFEIILDSEVGDTSLTRARNIEREIGLRQIYLKFEGGNPTGTQKDRVAFAQALDALRRASRA